MQRIYLLSALFYFLVLPMSAQAKTTLKPVDFTPAELHNIQGHFSSIYGHFYIKTQGKQVSTSYEGKYIQLIKKSDNHFYAQYKFLWVFPINLGDMSFSIRKNRNNKIQILVHQGKYSQVVAQKFVSKPIPQAWKKRLGTYKAKRLAGNSNIKKVRLGIRQGALVAYINNLTSPYPLIAHSNSQLTSPSAGNNYDRIIRISSNKNSILLNYDKNKLELRR